MSSIKNTAVDTAESSAAFKRRFMWRLLAVLIGGMLLDGYILGVIGPVTTPMKEDLGMSTWELGLVASAALFGILIGSPLGGVVEQVRDAHCTLPRLFCGHCGCGE